MAGDDERSRAADPPRSACDPAARRGRRFRGSYGAAVDSLGSLVGCRLARSARCAPGESRVHAAPAERSIPGTVTLPLWLVALLALLAGWAFLDRLLVPSVRWALRRRVSRVLEEVGARLQIDIRPFQLTKRQVLIDRLVYDPRVMEAAASAAQRDGIPRDVAQERVVRYAREIVPSFNAYFYFRIGYWLARRAAQALYRVRLGFADEAGLAAIRSGSTVVFVVNHRSNMDYILVAYLAAERTALSYAVGEWARIWPLESLIRAMGAYFVRRASRDDLYRRVLESYVRMATSEGVPQAVFPEGRLTRDGRLQAAKLGLFDYMLRSFDPEGPGDVVFVPVGINYDRVLEDRTLLLDVAPGARRKRRWAALLTLLRFLAANLALVARGRWHRFGYACVNFGTPLSAKAYLRDRDLDLRRLGREERFARVADLAAALMAAVGDVVPVVPVALVATLLAGDAGRAWSELEWNAEAQRLIERLEAAGVHVYVPRRDRDYAIVVGLRMLTLRHLVAERGGLYRARPEELPLLRYYANSIAHLVSGLSSAGSDREPTTVDSSPGSRRF